MEDFVSALGILSCGDTRPVVLWQWIRVISKHHCCEVSQLPGKYRGQISSM